MPTYQIRQTRMRAPQPAALFFDDFLGSSLDVNKWIAIDRIGDLANSEVACMLPANISVASSLLSGVSKFEDHTCQDSLTGPTLEHYTSWQIMQLGGAFTYGTVDCRMKLPAGTGVWPTFFLLGYKWQQSQPSTADDPAADGADQGFGEIDIAEFLSNSRTTINNAAHVGSSDGSHLASLSFDASTQFAVYRLVWTSASLTWQVNAEDGNGFVTTRTLTAASGRVPTVPMYITINAAVGGIGGGTPNSSTFPQTFQIDYVRVTQP